MHQTSELGLEEITTVVSSAMAEAETIAMAGEIQKTEAVKAGLMADKRESKKDGRTEDLEVIDIECRQKVLSNKKSCCSKQNKSRKESRQKNSSSEESRAIIGRTDSAGITIIAGTVAMKERVSACKEKAESNRVR